MVQQWKKSTCNLRDVCSIPVSGRSPGEGNGNPLQSSYLGNPMDRKASWTTVRGVTKIQTWVSKHTCMLLYTWQICKEIRFRVIQDWRCINPNGYITLKSVSSVAQSCPTLCDSIDCSMPGFPVHHQLPELAQTHVHRVCDAIQPSHPSSVDPFSSCLQSCPATRSFPMSQSFTSGGQSIGASASASVLPMNIQDWFPLGWTGLISLQSKGLSRVFFNTTVQKHRFFGAQLSLQSNSHIYTGLLEKQ